MDLIRLISKLFSEHIEEGNRIVIITKGMSKQELAKLEKDVKKKKTDEQVTEKQEINEDRPSIEA